MPVTVVETVRRKTDSKCHATTCRDGNCSLLLHGVPEPSVLISLEHEAAPVAVGKPRSDYLFLGSDKNSGLWVAQISSHRSSRRHSPQ